MADIVFRPAVRTATSLLIALAGPSGCGKTYSALRLARGLVGDQGKIAVIDAEAGRALHYSDAFTFDHLELRPPFRPAAYEEAVAAAEKAGYKAIVIDSMSHEHDGIGGCVEWADDIAQKSGRDNAGKWKLPKEAHKRMMQRFLQSRVHLIFCLRADEKIRITSEKKQAEEAFYARMAGSALATSVDALRAAAAEQTRGLSEKMIVVPAGWTPVCEKRFMYEMTASFLMLPDQPGVPRPIKLQQQHKHAFPAGQQISERNSAALGLWARGGKPPAEPVDAPPPELSADQATLSELTAALARRNSKAELDAYATSPAVSRILEKHAGIQDQFSAAYHRRSTEISAQEFAAARR